MQDILSNDRAHFIFDENLEKIKKAIEHASEEEYIAVHYPSYRNEEKDKTCLEPYIPWIRVLEDCE